MAAFEMTLKPEEVWKFYNDNASRMAKDLVCIAHSDSAGYEIFITEEDGIPCVIVYRGTLQVYEEGMVSAADAESTIRNVYKTYLIPGTAQQSAKSADSPEEDDKDIQEPEDDTDTRLDQEDQIYEREDAIYLAFGEFLNVLTEDDRLCTDIFPDDSAVDTAINCILEYLAVDHGIRIRRPMFIQDMDTGVEVFSEYPYEEYDFSST